MKKILLKTTAILLIIAGCFSCGKDPTLLKGTKWKLTGFIDAMTDVLTVPVPKDCKDCYTLTFDTEYTAIAHSITIDVHFDLRDLNSNRAITLMYQDEGYPNGHGQDFRTAIAIVGSFSLIADELKLFYYDNKNYLLFKRGK
ncbi:MAG: hypothetical protein LBU42_10275 [Prevotellaceae bacterium]|jgi:hypothetical protein|nr:hypothetical protein [Prevotellaceae bacterium]